jgi:YesN/AraC family two-component response regulator
MEEKVLFIGNKKALELYGNIKLKTSRVKKCLFSEALSNIRDTEIDIIVLDCGFRTREGIELLKRIKLLSPSTIVIFVSEASIKNTILEAFRAGAREYLTTPVDINRLKEVIENFIDIKKTTRERRVPYFLEHDDTVLTHVPSDSISKAIKYIELNLSEDLSLSVLSRIANLSKYHFCRLFKKKTGLTPMKFVSKKRIERAKELLQREDITISTIAFEVGFNDIGHFVKKFKAYTGLTPTSYRKLFQKD